MSDAIRAHSASQTERDRFIRSSFSKLGGTYCASPANSAGDGKDVDFVEDESWFTEPQQRPEFSALHKRARCIESKIALPRSTNRCAVTVYGTSGDGSLIVGR